MTLEKVPVRELKVGDFFLWDHPYGIYEYTEKYPDAAEYWEYCNRNLWTAKVQLVLIPVTEGIEGDRKVYRINK
jgi:uncharacterized Fe-S radical SAM superfamily protein PflX